MVRSNRQAQAQEPNSRTVEERSPVLTKKALLGSHGADPNDVKKVEDVFKRYGLTVVDRNDPAASIRFDGPAEGMERAFAVHLFKARHEGRTYRARTRDVDIPKELDGIVLGVFGLDNRRMTRHRRQVSKKSISNSASGKSGALVKKGRLWLLKRYYTQPIPVFVLGQEALDVREPVARWTRPLGSNEALRRMRASFPGRPKLRERVELLQPFSVNSLASLSAPCPFGSFVGLVHQVTRKVHAGGT